MKRTTHRIAIVTLLLGVPFVQAGTPATGPLRVSTANPRYFADGSGLGPPFCAGNRGKKNAGGMPALLGHPSGKGKAIARLPWTYSLVPSRPTRIPAAGARGKSRAGTEERVLCAYADTSGGGL